MERGMVELTEEEMLEIVVMMKMKISRLEEENKKHEKSLKSGNYSPSSNEKLKKWIDENEAEMKRLDHFGKDIISRFNRGRIEGAN